MKKVLFTLAVVLGMATAAQAQLVVGGSISFNGGTNKTMWDGNWGAKTPLNPGNKTSNFGFGIAPNVGYLINDNMQAGIKLNFSYNQSDTCAAIENVDGKSAATYVKDRHNTTFEWYVAPYFRYRLFDVKGFGFWLQAEVDLGTTLESKTKYYAYGSATELGAKSTYAPNGWRSADEAKELNKAVPGHKYSKFSGAGYIKPVLTYDINEHWIIESELDLLSVGVWGYSEKITEKAANRELNDASITETRSNCNFNLGLFQGKALSLGVVYKF